MALVKEVLASAVDDAVVSGALPPGEVAAIAARMKAVDALWRENKRAKYKLEVMFSDERSAMRPFGGVVTWWENGSRLHGGGDAKLYLCPGKELGKSECTAFLLDKANALGRVVCPACGMMWKNDVVFGEVFYRLTSRKWAEVITKWFLRMELNADIRLKYAKDDIRAVALLEQERQRGGELLTKARSVERRATGIYPLAHIIKDTSTGTSLEDRIYAFLVS